MMTKETAKKSAPEENSKNPAEGAGLVDAHTTVTAERALKLLKTGVEGEDARQKARREIAGEEIADPMKAYHNLEQALHIVRHYFGETLKIKLDDIHFKKFHGDMVGESTQEGTFVDPIMLMHPALRLAHVIAHETAHDKKRILNEGLVEGYVHLWFGHDDVEHKYDEAIKKFQEFARKFDKKGDIRAATKKIYELYYSGHFEELFEEYEKNCIEGLKDEKDKDRAFEFFREVFPELHYVVEGEKAGHFNLSHLKGRKKAQKGKHGPKESIKEKGNVVNFDAYRKRVSEREEQVRKTGTEG